MDPITKMILAAISTAFTVVSQQAAAGAAKDAAGVRTAEIEREAEARKLEGTKQQLDLVRNYATRDAERRTLMGASGADLHSGSNDAILRRDYRVFMTDYDMLGIRIRLTGSQAESQRAMIGIGVKQKQTEANIASGKAIFDLGYTGVETYGTDPANWFPDSKSYPVIS